MKEVKNICDIKSGFPFSSNDYISNGKYKLITIKNVLDGYISTNTDNDIETLPNNLPEYCKLKLGDTLLSLTGNVGRVGFVFEENLLLNQRVGLLNLKNISYFAYTYLLFRSSEFSKILEQISSGSNQKNLSPIEAEKLPIVYNPDIFHKFNTVVAPILQTIISNYRENKELSKLRNFLLPMLMNGQVEVFD